VYDGQAEYQNPRPRRATVRPVANASAQNCCLATKPADRGEYRQASELLRESHRHLKGVSATKKMGYRIGLSVHNRMGSTTYAFVRASAARSTGADRDNCPVCRVPGRRVNKRDMPRYSRPRGGYINDAVIALRLVLQVSQVPCLPK
jgi:hypothetical protein